MASSEESNFENSWRKAFNHADEAPDPAIWARIEAQLDKDDDPIIVIPFWRRWQTLATVAAAGVTFLFMLLGDNWFSSPQVPGRSLVMEKRQRLPQKTGLKSQARQEKTPTVAMAEKTEIPATILQEKTTFVPSKKKIKGTDLKHDLESKVLNKRDLAKINSSNKTNSLIEDNFTLIQSITQETTKNTDLISQSADLFNQNISPVSTPVTTLSLLEIKAMNDLLGPSKPQPWVVYQASSSEQKVSKTSTKQYWMSASIMPASYNAGVVIEGTQMIGGNFSSIKQAAFYNTVPSDESANRPSFSYSLQWHGGVQLAQRWSLETGLNYLQGNSVFEATNGFNVFTNSYVNNLEAAVSASESNRQIYTLSSINADKAQVQPLTTLQNIRNSYQFLQVPLQAGYALVKPKKKFSLWLLGGVINNIFLKNSFKSGQERDVNVSGDANPYRKLSFSASTGLRVQYRINKRWSSQLTGNYQLALGNTTQQDAVFEARPHLLGVSAGLRYGF